MPRGYRRLAQHDPQEDRASLEQAATTSDTPALRHPPNTSRSDSSVPHTLRRYSSANQLTSRSSIYRPRSAYYSIGTVPESILIDLQQGFSQGEIRPTGGMEAAAGKERAVEGSWTVISKKKKKVAKQRNRKGKSGRRHADPNDEITSSIFVPWVPETGPEDASLQPSFTWNHQAPPAPAVFTSIVDSVRLAIVQGTYPQPISRGSSGSYFCRNPEGRVVGVFKPNDEEPYGELNRKWTKWLHRNLFPCFFGRSCLIPNIGYLSESAASLIDTRLGPLGIVPPTAVVHLNSPTFQYVGHDRRTTHPAKRHAATPLPDKAGSFQCFLDGFSDATVFLREHPWPEEGRGWGCFGEDEGEREGEGEGRERFRWTPRLRRQFKEEFEKMVVLDYLIRNTDRGLDNWMIKYCNGKPTASAATGPQPPMVQKSTPPGLDILPLSISQTAAAVTSTTAKSADSDSEPVPVPLSTSRRLSTNTEDFSDASIPAPSPPPRRLSANISDLPDASSSFSPQHADSHFSVPHLHVAAIDNGLAFPYKHPDRWRSYPFGWTRLPTSLVNLPFSLATRERFLPLLSSPAWWRDTVRHLRDLFSSDPRFDERLFRRQIAVMKGQGWNLVEVLRDPATGPVELVERPRAVVWEEVVTVLVEEKGMIGVGSGGEEDEVGNVETASEIGPVEGVKTTTLEQADESGDVSPKDIAEEDKGLGTELASSSKEESKKGKWHDRFRRHIRLGLGKGREDKAAGAGRESVERRATIVVERVEIVPDARPCFTCC
ncbi:phosphatidylinositol 3 and 4-kinase-domain-containing protein [Endogone sp. FLAS-F59071]|nr:phosphatidylinositol 3 and 4-kinase-domain-containing protein [Endogone sp. FLAS-F59071]|eukprot:RUS15447.1 phosphatidylinositol 3 and 4-kinase-domain-containing protein [Endogone sp. FLAS-F59071]